MHAVIQSANNIAATLKSKCDPSYCWGQTVCLKYFRLQYIYNSLNSLHKKNIQWATALWQRSELVGADRKATVTQIKESRSSHCLHFQFHHPEVNGFFKLKSITQARDIFTFYSMTFITSVIPCLWFFFNAFACLEKGDSLQVPK